MTGPKSGPTPFGGKKGKKKIPRSGELGGKGDKRRGKKTVRSQSKMQMGEITRDQPRDGAGSQ